MERFPSELIPINVWANNLNRIVQTKVKKRQSRAERLKNLKQNIDILIGLMKSLLQRVHQEKQKKSSQAKHDIYSHRIFDAFSDILKSIDKVTFHEAKAMIGKSLRDDYSILEQAAQSQKSATEAAH